VADSSITRVFLRGRSELDNNFNDIRVRSFILNGAPVRK
jgi:hypothetical protein